MAEQWWRERIEISQLRPLFWALCDLEPGDTVDELLAYTAGRAWVSTMRQQMSSAGRVDAFPPWKRGDYDLQELLWDLYALSRVRDVLLFSRQPPPLDAEAKREFDEVLRRTAPVFEPAPIDQILDFFSLFGCRPVTETRFDPILHEIVICEPAAQPDAPIEILEQRWPCLLIGDLVFTRAGVRVRAGSRWAAPGVADRSTLHWEYWRRYRDTSDYSFFFGKSSQWKTQFRRDYVTDHGNVFNLDGDARDVESLRTSGLQAPVLPESEVVEFVKHRYRLRSADRFVVPNWMVDERPGN